jgi:hypothetical protein
LPSEGKPDRNSSIFPPIGFIIYLQHDAPLSHLVRRAITPVTDACVGALSARCPSARCECVVRCATVGAQ